MKTRTKAVVIGGGVAGCSTLYHLTQEGWSDAMLLERDELTNFGMNQTMVGLKSHSIALYQDLAADADYPINDHQGGASSGCVHGAPVFLHRRNPGQSHSAKPL